jgi:hypothetical protein
MDAAELRALQGPVKQRYREHPESAQASLAASATWSDPGITCTVDGFAGPVRGWGGSRTMGSKRPSHACSPLVR